jgi:glutathione peroxidase
MRKLIIGTVVTVALIAAYVIFINRNSMEMTARQKILKAFYPVLSGINRLFGANSTVLTNEERKQPTTSLYDIEVTMIDGTRKTMSAFRGKKLLIVNTASDCGYTGQYEMLQELYEKEKGNLEIIGFPANDFKEQEKGGNEEIAAFCKKNYGVSFPLAAKGVVVKTDAQQEVYRWLTDKTKNGWNTQSPAWNFSKYLISEDGILLNYFGPAVEPSNEQFRQALKQ